MRSMSIESRSNREGARNTAAASAQLRAPSGLVLPFDARVDWSRWYLTDEDDVGESFEHGEMIRLLLSCLEVLAAERGWVGRVIASDQYFAWREDEPLVRVAPDVYLLDDAPPPPRPASWQTWLPGHRAPVLAIEIVSDDWRKDYEEAPAKYWQLGCPELVIFDPDAALGVAPQRERVALHAYRRDADGAFVRVVADGPLACAAIDAFFVPVREGNTMRLRIARDALGRDRVGSLAELRAEEAAARAQAEARVRELERRLAGLDDE